MGAKKPDKQTELVCIVDGLRGIYVPQHFANSGWAEQLAVSREDREILTAGPDNPEYWDVWDDIIRSGIVEEIDGNVFIAEGDAN